MKYKIPFSTRSHIYNLNELKLVKKIMMGPETLTQGKYLKRFENKFNSKMGTKYAFAMSNATAALEVSAQLCNFEKNDEIVIPAHTYVSSAYPFAKFGAKIVWADIDLKTRVVTYETIKKCINKKTKAIVVVHLYGYMANIKKIMKLAKKRNIIVIEDAAQALGSELFRKKAGTYGDFGIFSFHSHKNISTLGEGGVLVVKNSKFAKLIPQLRHNGHCDFTFIKKKYWIPAMSNVDISKINNKFIWPSNFCLSEINCAVGTKIIDRLEKINNKKRDRAIKFIKSFANNKDIEFHKVMSKRHNYHLLVGRLINKNRDKFIEIMSKKMGIQCVIQYYPLYKYDFFKKIGLGEAECPNSELFYDNMISFPFQHMMKESDIRYMIDKTKEVLKMI